MYVKVRKKSPELKRSKFWESNARDDDNTDFLCYEKIT